MRAIRTVGLVALVALTSACGSSSKFQTYDGPEVTRVAVFKEQRRMYLIHDRQVLKHYEVDLGFAPTGDKKVEGDGRTPEGDYMINRRNPNSKFHLSLGISYPNAQDRIEAARLGQRPGGDIFIHGGPRKTDKDGPDWTAGCISVSDDEMEEIYAMVDDGTVVSIYQ